MRFPDSYYYEEKSSEEKYGMNPPGELVVEKFIEGKPYWQKPATKPIQKKKTLLLHSLSDVLPSKQKKDELRKHIQSLLSDGFDIYINSNDRLIKLTANNLYLLDEFKKNRTTLQKRMTPAQTKERACEELNLANNKIQLIGDVELGILNRLSDGTYSIGIESVFTGIFGMDKVRATQWLDSRMQDDVKITQIHQNSSSDTNQNIRKMLQSQLDNISIIENITELAIQDPINLSNIHDLMPSDTNAITRLRIDNILIKNAKSPEEIEILSRLVRNTNNIVEIMISNVVLNEIDELLSSCLNKIKFYDIQRSEMNTSELVSHLNKMGQLYHLALFQINIIDDNFRDETLLQLEKLEILELKSCSNSHNLLQAILSSCKRLKSIKLNDIKLDKDFDWTSVDLASLEELEIQSDDINTNFLKGIFARAPNLKKIRLSGNFVIKADCYPNITSFLKLESLEIEKATVSDFFIMDVYINSKNIRRLAFDHTSTIDTVGILPIPHSVEQYSYLQLKNTNEDENTFQTIEELNKITNLNELEISIPFNIVAPKLAILKMLQLKKLKIKIGEHTDDIDEGHVQNMIKVISGVITLSLIKCVHLTHLAFDVSEQNPITLDSLNLELTSFPNLFFYDIGGIKYDDDSLIMLLNSAPNLKYLNMKNIDSLRACPNALLMLSKRNIDVISSNFTVRLDELQKKGELETPSYDQLKQRSITANIAKKLDANTELKPGTEFKLERIFFPLNENSEPPAITSYRVSCYNTAYISPTYCTMQDAFDLKNEGDLQLIGIEFEPIKLEHDVNLYKNCFEDNAESTNYYGKQTLAISNEWQALYSLSPNEFMLGYHLSPNDDVEINYSVRDNQYYIRTKSEPKIISIDFVLAVPKATPRHLPPEIQSLVEYYQSFGMNKLQLPDKQLTGEDYFGYIYQQRVGACRHRSLMMKAHIDRVFPYYQARIVDNDCHSYVEVNIQGAWVKCDLGGYPARLTIDDKNNPANPSTTPRITSTSIENEFSKIKHYQARLRTWESKKSSTESALQFFQRQVNWSVGGKNHLIKVNNDGDVLSLRLSLQNHCRDIHRPVFYIDSPDDLACNSNYITRDGNNGKVNKGPGGALYDFLTAAYDKSNPPILIVNYNNFEADDLVRLNSVIDKHRRVDTTPVPNSMRIIGILNLNKPGCYQGSDFYSRFDEIETCTLPLQSLSPPQLKTDIEGDSYIINLSHSLDWKERLLGRWRFQGDQLIFIEGELGKAIASGKSIEIQNGLWELPKFRQFWHDVMADFRHHQLMNGISTPRELNLIQSNGYKWNDLKNWVTITQTFEPRSTHLNPTSLKDYINQYQLIDEKLFSEPGIIEMAKGGTLDIALTRSITTDEWATLLLLCDQHQVKLNLFCTEGVELPAELSEPHQQPKNQRIITKEHTQIFYSNDCDAAIQNDLNNQDWIVIDVSECQPNDLLKNLTGSFDQSSLSYRFNETEQALLTALREGKNIALTGEFSNELVDAITSLILARNNDPTTPGQLRIYHSNQAQFQCIETKHYMIDAEFKYQTLLEQFQEQKYKNVIYELSKSELETQSYSQLIATIHTKLTSQTSDPWQGMYSLPSIVKLEPFDLTQSETASSKVADFNQQRLNAINEVLQYSPYVYLAGLTAVGKTTFVEKVLKDQPNTTLYQGENLTQAWANDKTSGTTKFLFIDEANVNSREWSEFESLFRQPPGILIDGVYHELTENHKVIFAGNPLSYGGERKLAPFFQRHGASVIFDPLPEAFIYQEIIKPIFIDGKISHSDVIAMTTSFLAIYRYLCERSTDEVLISPREIQMMALLVKSYHEKYPDQPIEDAANHYGYLIAHHLAPPLYREQFQEIFSPISAITQSSPITAGQKDYLLTPSRIVISQHLHDLLNLREYRDHDPTANDATKYGGLGGIIIEGEPGIGKSELIIHTLVSAGFHEAHLDKPIPDKPFYHLSINMSQHDKEHLLLTAFDQGAIVVIDEINSAPMMERLLNDLLMGRDQNGKPPSRPGFMVIGTQNPSTLEGRREATTALARRLTITMLSPYTKNEMLHILRQKGFGPDTATAMVTAYESNVAQAKQQRLKPAPTFRDLMKEAGYELEAIDRHVSEMTTSLKQHFVSPTYGSEGMLAYSITAARIDHAIHQITTSPNYSPDNQTAYVHALTKQLNLNELEHCTQFSQIQAAIKQVETDTLTLDEMLANLEFKYLQLITDVRRHPQAGIGDQTVIEEALASIEKYRGKLFTTVNVAQMKNTLQFINEQLLEINKKSLFIESKLAHQQSSIFKEPIIDNSDAPPTHLSIEKSAFKRK